MHVTAFVWCALGILFPLELTLYTHAIAGAA